MRTDHDGSTYELVFKHLYSKPMYDKVTGELTYTLESDSPLGTLCIVRADGFDISEGLVWCHVDDQSSKADGRKYALTKAVADFSKPLRSALWECYLDRRPDLTLVADEIVHQQGWTDLQTLALTWSFLNEYNFMGKFTNWLRGLAKYENQELFYEDELILEEEKNENT